MKRESKGTGRLSNDQMRVLAQMYTDVRLDLRRAADVCGVAHTSVRAWVGSEAFCKGLDAVYRIQDMALSRRRELATFDEEAAAAAVAIVPNIRARARRTRDGSAEEAAPPAPTPEPLSREELDAMIHGQEPPDAQ